MSDNCPMWWDRDRKRWVIELPSTMPQDLLDTTITYVMHVQMQRRKGMIAGDVRDDLDESIKALQNKRVIQRPRVSRGGEARVFTSTERIGNRIISLGGNHGS